MTDTATRAPQDDDWMLVRQQPQTENCQTTPEQEIRGFEIDPQVLEKRGQRKQHVPQQAGDSRTDPEPWLYIDRGLAEHRPAFPDRTWTLGDTARWVIERTPEAVNGLSIEGDKLVEVLPEIQNALSSGEICACAITPTDPVPRELPAATWSIYTLIVEEKNGFIRIFPRNTGSASTDEQLQHLRVRRDDVLQRWSSRSNKKVVQKTTIGAENECKRWLAEMMRRAPARPKSKAEIHQEARAKSQHRRCGRSADQPGDKRRTSMRSNNSCQKTFTPPFYLICIR